MAEDAWQAAIGQTWVHVEEPPATSGHREKLSDDDIRSMFAMAAAGVRQTEIARRFGIHPSHVFKTLSHQRRRAVAV